MNSTLSPETIKQEQVTGPLHTLKHRRVFNTKNSFRMHPESLSSEIVITVFNMNTDRRLADVESIKQHFGVLGPLNREFLIKLLLLDQIKHNEIQVIFEMAADSLGRIAKFCYDLGLNHASFCYNKSVGAFNFLVISKMDNVCFDARAFPLTHDDTYEDNTTRPKMPFISKPEDDAPQEIKDQFANQERYTKKTLGDNFEKTAILIPIGTGQNEFHVWVTHMGLQNVPRIEQSKKLIELVQRYSKSIKFMITGDFNCFDMTKPKGLLMHQIEILKSLPNTIWATANLETTFRAYPYDIEFKLPLVLKGIYNYLKAFDPTNKLNNPNVVLDMQKFEELKPTFNKEMFTLVDGKEQLQMTYQELDLCLNFCVPVNFGTFCNKMAKNYGLDGGALDHVFVNGLDDVKVEVFDLDTVSDHFLVRTTVYLGKSDQTDFEIEL